MDGFVFPFYFPGQNTFCNPHVPFWFWSKPSCVIYIPKSELFFPDI